MTASNLGIIFGPTLIKPRQTDAEVSLSSLVDYPYQALIVELLIRHYELIFDSPLSPAMDESSPLPIKSRFTPQEKEQRLNRHSRSLMDIKEVCTCCYFLLLPDLRGVCATERLNSTTVCFMCFSSTTALRPIKGTRL